MPFAAAPLALLAVLVTSDPGGVPSSSPRGSGRGQAHTAPRDGGAPTTAEIKTWRLGPDSYGPVRIGMTVAQASKALGRALDPGPLDPDEQECFYGRHIPEPVLEHVGFMFLDGRLARIDVHSVQRGSTYVPTRDVQTREGAGLGTTEAELRRLYPTAKTEPHHYTSDIGGHYVVAVKERRGFVFETEGERVTTFRAGNTRAISLVEGCL